MTATFDCLARLRVGHSNGKPAPHKPCLLLSMICEIQAGHISSNKVVIDRRLLARYHALFELAGGERHKASPWLPLWHLRNDQGPGGASGHRITRLNWPPWWTSSASQSL